MKKNLNFDGIRETGPHCSVAQLIYQANTLVESQVNMKIKSIWYL